MMCADRGRIRFGVKGIVVALAAVLAASCTSAPPKSMVVKKPTTKEYFPESKYGVKASPRVSNLRTRLPRGGGRDQIGKPYMVAGKMYYPKEDKKYRRVGKASWYGDAFHGRLTANGEIYDMTHLTAAHPTMPLPSYARVTNTKNGASLIVRVNDRGPYANGRIIDLSRRAAEMLDYTHTGTANVMVEYVGRAPLDGQDDSYLMASYHPGNKVPDPSDGLPTGVMIAMNGSTPTVSADGQSPSVAFPGQLNDVAVAASPAVDVASLKLPDLGPIAPVRPAYELALPEQTQVAMATMSYASEPTNGAAMALAAISGDETARAGLGWKQPDASASVAASAEYIAAGSFEDRTDAAALVAGLSDLGRPAIDATQVDGKTIYTVSLYPDGRLSVDAMLEAAWQQGAPDAISVRE
ncbi:MAG: septal ring lytic transglycosylase RlpA family protein [Rhizobiaceae bacterium]|nr:septal ring lytic transglycosylase RlpA family protein [Rhizobiaceae bacterium]